MEYNLYCDETCHLENDKSNSMALGTVVLPKEKRKRIFQAIVDIKAKYHISASNEVKWTKARNKMLPLYIDLIDYFFDNNDMSFRVLLIPNKNLLNHQKWNQTHNTWYYKMYFEMLKPIFNTYDQYNVYVDVKDTHSAFRIDQLHEVCANNLHDFGHTCIQNIQPIRSDEVQVMQITDILIGAVCRANRNLQISHANKAKEEIIRHIAERSHSNLKDSTVPWAKKFNLFVWRAQQ